MKVGFIGVGNMGGTLAIAASKTVEPKDILLYDLDSEKVSTLSKKTGAVAADLEEVLRADFVFLGVKPQVLPGVLSDIKEKIGESSILVSMAAAVSIDAICGIVGNRAVIRIMPNTPAAYSEGMMLLCSKNVEKAAVDSFKEIMSASGKVEEIPEELIDAGSAVSGCGPAFSYMFINALAEGGAKCGLSYDTALRLAAQTVLGSAKTVLMSDKSPEELRIAVCSPGGTTIEGVHALEDGNLNSLAISAVEAAYEKTLKLAKK